jgi:hypothetical protein
MAQMRLSSTEKFWGARPSRVLVKASTPSRTSSPKPVKINQGQEFVVADMTTSTRDGRALPNPKRSVATRLGRVARNGAQRRGYNTIGVIRVIRGLKHKRESAERIFTSRR